MVTRSVSLLLLLCTFLVSSIAVPEAARASQWENVGKDTKYADSRPKVEKGETPEVFSFTEGCKAWRSAALRQLAGELWQGARQVPGKTLAQVVAGKDWTQKSWGNRRVIGARLTNQWQQTKREILEPFRSVSRSVDRLATGFGLNKKSQVGRGGKPWAKNLNRWAGQANLQLRNCGLPQLPFGTRYASRTKR